MFNTRRHYEKKRKVAKKKVDTKKPFGRARQPLTTLSQNGTMFISGKENQGDSIQLVVNNFQKKPGSRETGKRSVSRIIMKLREGTKESMSKTKMLEGINEELIEEGFKENINLEERVRIAKLEELKDEYRHTDNEIANARRRNIHLQQRQLFKYSADTSAQIEKAFNTLEKENNHSMLIEIFQHQMNKQTKDCPHFGFLKSQTELDEDKRRTIWNWIIAIHHKFEMNQQSLILTLNIIDRYCSYKRVPSKSYHLLAITSLFIAAKYEEIYFPTLKDLCYLCKNRISKQNIIDMEKKVLCVLNFRLTVVHPETFLYKSVIAFKTMMSEELFKKFHSGCKMFLEIAMSWYGSLRYESSRVAAAVSYTMGKILIGNANFQWNKIFQLMTGYKEHELLPLYRNIEKEARLLLNPTCNLVSIKRKYLSPQNDGIALDILDKLFGNVTPQEREKYKSIESEYKFKIAEKEKLEKQEQERDYDYHMQEED